MLIADTTLSTILADVGTVFQALIGYVGSVCETIVSNPLLLIGVCLPIAFAIISFVRRLFNF